MIEFSRKNAKNAGVDHLIHFQPRAVSELSHSKKYGFIITNPPYGKRIGEEDEISEIYEALKKFFK